MMKRYIKNNVIRSVEVVDGKVATTIEVGGRYKSYPTVAEFEADGWSEYIEAEAAEQTIDEAKASKLAEIEAYDSSSEVNGFVYNGQTLWLDKSMRAYIKNGVEAVIAKGDATYPLWNGDVCITLGCEALLQILTEIEAYAVHCYNVTAQHKANVATLTTIADVEAYDYKVGYPAMLRFGEEAKG